VIYGKFYTILDESGKEIFRCTDYGIKRTSSWSLESFRMLETVEEQKDERQVDRDIHPT